LAIGISHVEGSFHFGDSVAIVNHKQEEIGRGLVNYSSSELEKIKGVPAKEIEGVLGYKHFDEVIHRDDLVLFER
jgi:glutamate 5-kinase